MRIVKVFITNYFYLFWVFITLLLNDFTFENDERFTYRETMFEKLIPHLRML